jgi:NAD(P)-dependent dehydrogenase (short-subunit alcohol dehydrogenase family)
MPNAAPPTALVTGAARGIGLATARRFLDDGWTVAMIDRDAPALMDAFAGLQHALPVVADVSVPGQVATMMELGEYGIRANCVAPGPVRTKLAMAVHSPEIIAAYHDAIPLNRYGTEAEIAEVIHFLCSPRASYVTGQTIAVDGGFQATGIGLPALRDQT